MSKMFPLNNSQMKALNLNSVDFVLVSGDAFIDHPSFGVAIIARVLESYGYTVGILAQPDWKNPEVFLEFGKPNLAYLVTAGNIDSMVNHYSVNKTRRKTDLYTPNNEINKRPNRATIVYSNQIKAVCKDKPIIIGGIEASIRRLSHYDYWSDSVRKSILLDSKADLLVYGMGEKTIVEIAQYLESGLNVSDITFIDGTVYKTKNIENVVNSQILPSYDEVLASKKAFNASFKIQYEVSMSYEQSRLIERYDDFYIVVNPQSTPLNEAELDKVYDLPFTYKIHPYYNDIGHIKAIDEIQFSIQANRGCYASCNFCEITYHQGRITTSRSVESVRKEALKISKLPNFKGNINDIGGPTANFMERACSLQENNRSCKDKKCIANTICDSLVITHQKYLQMIKAVESIESIKKVFIRSGIRYDYLLKDRHKTFMHKLVKDHVSGQLRLAPEHICENTLKLMGKPVNSVYEQFCDEFYKLSTKYKKEQYIVPYLMSSHPGSDIKSAIKLAEYLHKINYQPLQVQDFYPTPGTLSTAMYYTRVNPFTNERVYVAKTEHDKKVQRALLQYKNPKNYQLVKEALLTAKRTDLIGTNKKCLIK